MSFAVPRSVGGGAASGLVLRRPPRPILLLLVYGVFLVIVGITAAGLVALTSAHVTTIVLNQAVSTDGQAVRRLIGEQLQLADVATTPPSPMRATQLSRALATLVAPGGIVRVELRRPDGTLVVDDTGVASATSAIQSEDWRTAAGGRVAAAIVPGSASEVAGSTLAQPDLLREYFPLVRDGTVDGVVAIWRDAGAIVAALADARRDILVVTMSAAALVALVLWLVFRSAQTRITAQTVALLEASRRDPLTGLLNHGALVESLSASVERLRVDGGGLAVAVLDLDNLANLNDTRGHAAGDEAIQSLATLLQRQAPQALIGRFGPDEFLIAVEGTAIGTLGGTLDTLRAALADIDLRVDGERLPLTVSAGVATFPDHGASVTELLATVGMALHEARISGGDAIRWAGVDGSHEPAVRTFDVLQGLILAVDAKDRYTKRHSEDVARYALFLADRVGLPAEIRQTLRIAGLLHDVGKIGIPDRILRKPGTLTDAEYRVVQQHVVLGDAIVRDLPDLETIRAAIRHHHERWDGDGYVEGLAGEAIPLLARVIAVGDTFSAMTTDRPYRKALGVDEALRRLEDAAGSQLEERLVAAFVRGIREDPHPPLPGDGGTVHAFEARKLVRARVA